MERGSRGSNKEGGGNTGDALQRCREQGRQGHGARAAARGVRLRLHPLLGPRQKPRLVLLLARLLLLTRPLQASRLLLLARPLQASRLLLLARPLMQASRLLLLGARLLPHLLVAPQQQARRPVRREQERLRALLPAQQPRQLIPQRAQALLLAAPLPAPLPQGGLQRLERTPLAAAPQQPRSAAAPAAARRLPREQRLAEAPLALLLQPAPQHQCPWEPPLLLLLLLLPRRRCRLEKHLAQSRHQAHRLPLLAGLHWAVLHAEAAAAAPAHRWPPPAAAWAQMVKHRLLPPLQLRHLPAAAVAPAAVALQAARSPQPP